MITWFRHKISGQIFDADPRFVEAYRRDPLCEEIPTPEKPVGAPTPNPDHPPTPEPSPSEGMADGEETEKKKTGKK